ncbi:hypothetical protein SAURM35S_00071 [Streptomyces aurantiogriseus]
MVELSYTPSPVAALGFSDSDCAITATGFCGSVLYVYLTVGSSVVGWVASQAATARPSGSYSYVVARLLASVALMVVPRPGSRVVISVKPVSTPSTTLLPVTVSIR